MRWPQLSGSLDFGHWARVGSMKPCLDIAGLEQDVVLEVALQSDEDEEWID